MTAEDETLIQPNATGPNKQAVVFTGHNAYVMSCARKNRDASQFTDVVLVCPDGNVTAHRLVLAAASTTLRKALLEVPANDAMPEGLHEHTIIVPEVKKAVVAGLVDFLYTGKLLLSRSNARDMQLLVRLLGIDPENVRVEALEEVSQKRLKQTQLTSVMGLTVKQNSQTDIVSTENHSNTIEETKPVPLRASKRRASQESSGSNGSSKEAKIGSLRSGQTSSPQPGSTSNLTPGRGSAKTRGRPRNGNRPGPSSARQSTSMQQQPSPLLTGYHDMSNVETWVCAICQCYDPVDAGQDQGSGDTTEWIGCDCNRWYHKICTRLPVVDENFNCSMVKLECLPV